VVKRKPFSGSRFNACIRPTLPSDTESAGRSRDSPWRSDDEAQVTRNQLVGGITIAVLAPALCELKLLFPFEHRKCLMSWR
jgi:hypothetical protein